MKLGIISRSPECYSTRRLVSAAQTRGHEVQVINPLRCSIDLESGLFENAKPIRRMDAAIPRIGPSITSFGTAVVRQMEQMGVFVVNGSDAIVASRDIPQCLQILNRHQIPVPDTTFVRNRGDVIPAVHRMGGLPIVVKVIEGPRTVGVVRADEMEIVEAVVATVQPAKQIVLVQRFPAGTARHLRAVVVADEVVGSVMLEPKDSSARPVKIDDRHREIAVHAAEVMCLGVAGVDLLETDEGLKVMGVCSSPGLRAIEDATEVDIAANIVNYVAARAEFPIAETLQRPVLVQRDKAFG